MGVMKATVVWSGDMSFTGHPPSGHAVLMDTAGAAPRPIELLLLGLGGCTGMDIVSILGKMRQVVTSLEIGLEADQDEEYPRAIREVRLSCRIRGKNLDEASVRRAVRLSEEKYCSVAATLRLPVVVTWALELAAE